MNSAKLALPNSLILIEDPSGGEIPASMSGSLVASTTSCIAVGTQSEVDGETEIWLGVSNKVDPGNQPVFQGKLKTPTRRISLRTVLRRTILEMPVRGELTFVQVWTDDLSEPEKIWVGVD